MIEVMSLNLKREWLPFIRERLEQHSSILYLDTELVVNQIIRGELAVFNVDNELIGVGYKFTSGNESVLFITFAFVVEEGSFFKFRKMLSRHFKQVVDYVKNSLGCDRLDFMCLNQTHKKFYDRQLDRLQNQSKREYYYKIIL